MTRAVSPPTATYCVPFHAIAFKVLPDAGCSVQALPSELVRTAPSLPTATNRAPCQRTSWVVVRWEQSRSRSDDVGARAWLQSFRSELERSAPLSPTPRYLLPVQVRRPIGGAIPW